MIGISGVVLLIVAFAVQESIQNLLNSEQVFGNRPGPYKYVKRLDADQTLPPTNVHYEVHYMTIPVRFFLGDDKTPVFITPQDSAKFQVADFHHVITEVWFRGYGNHLLMKAFYIHRGTLKHAVFVTDKDAPLNRLLKNVSFAEADSVTLEQRFRLQWQDVESNSFSEEHLTKFVDVYAPL